MIDAIIQTRADLHVQLIKSYALVMAERFKERVDDVKCDLLNAFKTLICCDNSGNESDVEKKRILTQLSD